MWAINEEKCWDGEQKLEVTNATNDISARSSEICVSLRQGFLIALRH